MVELVDEAKDKLSQYKISNREHCVGDYYFTEARVNGVEYRTVMAWDENQIKTMNFNNFKVDVMQCSIEALDRVYPNWNKTIETPGYIHWNN